MYQSHPSIIRTSISLWNSPINILADHFNTAGFTMQTILRIDLKFIFPGFGFHELINFRRTELLFGPSVLDQTFQREIGFRRFYF